MRKKDITTPAPAALYSGTSPSTPIGELASEPRTDTEKVSAWHILSEIRRTYRFPFWMLFGAILLVVVLFVMKLYALVATAPASGFSEVIASMMRDADLIGLVAGLAGIGVGIFLTIIIQRQNRESDEQTNEATQLIKKDLAGAVAKLQTIVERDDKFQARDNLRDVFQVITSSFDDALANEKGVYVMNYSASFGYLLSFRFRTVLDFAGISPSDAATLSCRRYHQAREELLEEHKRVFKHVKDVGEKIHTNFSKPVHYATYCPSTPEGNSPYQLQHLEKVFKSGVKIVAYDGLSDDPINIPIDLNDSSAEAYFVPDTTRDLDTNATLLRRTFIQHLLWKQKEDIKALKVHKFLVSEIADIPVQIYLSEEKSGRGQCLFMFVNHKTIPGSEAKIVAFLSKNEPYVIESFKNMILGAH